LFGKSDSAANAAYLLFIIIGIGLIIGSIVSGIRGSKELDGMLPVEAVVSRVDNTWNGISTSDTIYVRYTVDGTLYESPLDYAPLNAQQGDVLDAFYLPDEPTKITTAVSTVALYLVLGVLGLAVFLLGFVPFLRGYLRRRDIAFLNDHGDVLHAEVISILRDTKRFSARTAYYICCRYRDPHGDYHQFKSDPVFFDPTSLVMGATLDVVVNPNDITHYYVDITHVVENENYQ